MLRALCPIGVRAQEARREWLCLNAYVPASERQSDLVFRSIGWMLDVSGRQIVCAVPMKYFGSAEGFWAWRVRRQPIAEPNELRWLVNGKQKMYTTHNVGWDQQQKRIGSTDVVGSTQWANSRSWQALFGAIVSI